MARRTASGRAERVPTVLTHPVVALALAPWFRSARERWGIVALGAACTVIPDIDVVGFRLGVPYAAPLGHRGFTHSLVFAAMLASVLAVSVAWRRTAWAALAAWCYFFLCTVSHGLLDALTDGGLGVALLAPFDSGRYFFPWRPLAVSPIGAAGFFSARGWLVIASELRWVVLPAAVVLFGGLVFRARTKTKAGG